MHGSDIIHNICVLNTDAVYYQSQTSKKCLETADHEKKKKHLHVCLNERRHFTPFVASADGLLGIEVEVTLERLSNRLTAKWKEGRGIF